MSETAAMSARRKALASRFERCALQLGARGDVAPLFDDLVRRYTEPQRAYHDLTHIEACLGWLDWFSGSAVRCAEVELALWYHDAVYEPVAHDNEARSARLARDALGSVHVATPVIARIAEMIEATAAHDAKLGDAALVVDIDLAILGASEQTFAAFESDVRREYAHVPEEAYRRGRSAVLAGFLSRQHIYQTKMVEELLDAPARRNLQRAIERLNLRESARPGALS